MAGTIDVAIVTEDMIMIDGMRAWLSRVGGVRLAMAAPTVEALLLSEIPVAQVVLLDLGYSGGSKPGRGGDVQRLARLRHRVLGIGTRYQPSAMDEAFTRGARGCVAREQGLTNLAAAIRAVATGRLLPPSAGGTPARLPLSRQERAVLIAYVSGMTLEAAARHVGISPDTAKTYLKRVKSKYQAAGRPAYTKADLARRVWEERDAARP